MDACLAHESARLERERLQEEEEFDIGSGRGSVRTRVITSASLRGQYTKEMFDYCLLHGQALVSMSEHLIRWMSRMR